MTTEQTKQKWPPEFAKEPRADDDVESQVMLAYTGFSVEEASDTGRRPPLKTRYALMWNVAMVLADELLRVRGLDLQEGSYMDSIRKYGYTEMAFFADNGRYRTYEELDSEAEAPQTPVTGDTNNG